MNEIKEIDRLKCIETRNILNHVDQVPRYFQDEHKTTITTKGLRKVIIRRAAENHRRFTATFTIATSGDILKPHCLFSKLKKIPQVNPNVMAAINGTGMWSQDVFKVSSNIFKF